MHLKCTDLNLERLTILSDQSRVKRLVHVRLRHRNIIFKTSRDRCVHFVDHTERRVTVFDTFYNNTNCENIVNLVQCFILVDHLFINTEEVFDTSADVAFDIRIYHMRLDLADNVFDIILTRLTGQCHFFFQILKYSRFQIFQSQIIQFNLNFRDTETVRKRCVDLDGLSGLFFLFFWLHILHGAHIVKTVRKFDQNHADILCHCEEHLTKVLRLHFHFIRRPVQLCQLGNAIHKEGHFFAEDLRQFLFCHDRIFHHIVEDAGDDRFFI